VSTRTLDEDLRAAAVAAPGQQALVSEGGPLSYAELDRAASGVAGRLQALGVRRGGRVAMLLPNGPEAVCTVFGVLRAGAAIVPLNPTIKADKLAYVLEDAGAEVVVCTASQESLALEVRDRAPSLREVVVAGGSNGSFALEQLVAASPGDAPRPLDVDLAAVVYTSGSTGTPKGVTMLHRNMRFVVGSIVEYLGMRQDDRVLSVLPLSFGYGLYQLLTCVHARATLVLERGFTFPGRVVQLLEEERITAMPGVPTIWQVLTSLPGLAEREFPHLRVVTNAGAALSPAGIAALRATFPSASLYSMYGQTECTRVSYLPPDQLDARPGSVGVPIPGTEAWIEDDEGHEVGPGEVGELVVRGGHVMQGYWNDAERTAARLRPGRWPWERVLATGDLFRRDEEGYLYFVARRDDIIKSRGEKVAPREVEDVLLAAEGVQEAAVVGMDDEVLGQAVHAHVAPRPDHELDVATLRRHCATHLESFMVPQRIVVHERLPRTDNGKIDRLSLAGPPAEDEG
jgi:long-chain acyl-CoA synthetase